MAKKNIRELAQVIRSKNSSPFELTFDIIFKDLNTFKEIRDRSLISKEMIARLFKMKESEITDLIYFEPAKAVKFGMRRTISSGAPGDTDVYGAQQHSPLLELEIDI